MDSGLYHNETANDMHDELCSKIQTSRIVNGNERSVKSGAK